MSDHTVDEKTSVAISALEVLLHGLLHCDSRDQVKVTFESTGNPPEIRIIGITIARDDAKIPLIDAQPLQIEGTLLIAGSGLLNAAKNFVLETLDPMCKFVRDSVPRLIAYTSEVDIEQEFLRESGRLEARTRLERGD